MPLQDECYILKLSQYLENLVIQILFGLRSLYLGFRSFWARNKGIKITQKCTLQIIFHFSSSGWPGRENSEAAWRKFSACYGTQKEKEEERYVYLYVWLYWRNCFPHLKQVSTCRILFSTVLTLIVYTVLFLVFPLEYCKVYIFDYGTFPVFSLHIIIIISM